MEEYGQSFDLASLTQAIEYSQEAVDLISIDNPNRASCLDNLSTCLSNRYEREGKIEDCIQAIEYSQEAVDLISIDNPDRASYLSNLGTCLSNRYEREGKLADLLQAIDYSQETVSLISTDNSNRAGYLSNLSNGLSTRYKRGGNFADLIQAIDYSREAVALNHADPNRAISLNTLSGHLCTRYESEGNVEDLTLAIEYAQEAIDLTSIDNPYRANRLHNLGKYLSIRYKREGNLKDLTQAIEYIQEAINLISISHPHRARYLSSFAHHLGIRYKREEKLGDLTQAIRYGQEAIKLIYPDDPDRAGWLNNLSNYLSTRYKRERSIEDLAQAIKYIQEAINLIPASDPYRAGYLTNLAGRLSMWYKREKNLGDLVQAIKYSQEAIDLIHTDNPNRAGWLNNLSADLVIRYRSEGKLEDLTQVIECSQIASKCLSSPPSQRLDGCQMAVYLLACSQRWYEAREMVGQDLEILPLLILNLSSKLHQENMMRSVSEIATIGCAVSLECNNDVYDAVRILEAGRGAINRLTIDSRADISTLLRFHPDLANRFEDLRCLINVPTGESTSNATRQSESIIAELNELISTIRTKEGFEDFQSLPSKDRLFDSLPNQATVLLNTTFFRTDALLVHSNRQEQVLVLEHSIFDRSKEYYSKLCGGSGWRDSEGWSESNVEMRCFLECLWDQVTAPVLDALNFQALEVLSQYDLPKDVDGTDRLALRRATDGLKGPDTNKLAIYQRLMERQPIILGYESINRSSRDISSAQTDTVLHDFPRIHWIGVGHLGAFPFHAAGYGSQSPPKNTMSCAISSYASTLTVRSFAKQKPAMLVPTSSAPLLVTMPETPNQNPLKGVAREAQIIQETANRLTAVKLREMEPINVILDDLPLYNIVHFACHGYADLQSPFQSGLLLCGDEPEKSFDENTRNSILTVETISSINIERAQLAFLSACCTAENASSVLMDEGIHLASGFQLAGYPHVIASLWEADDNLSVAVAKRFYQILFAESNIVGHERIAYALHMATLAARRICGSPLAWAPTIHFGP